MRLALSTWPEVEAYLARSRGIIVPVGSTEQHGPTGLIGTDALCAEAIAAGVGEAIDQLVAPTLAFSPAQFNMAFPGTVSLRASTFMALATDCIESLARHGFERIYFLNGHGANLAPLRSAIHDVYAGLASGARLRIRVRSWWDLPAVDALRRSLYAGREGMHATPSEIAIALAAHPGSERDADPGRFDALDPAWMREHAGDAHDPADAHREAFALGPVGSDPSLARAADGRALLDAAIGDAAAEYMRWLES